MVGQHIIDLVRIASLHASITLQLVGRLQDLLLDNLVTIINVMPLNWHAAWHYRSARNRVNMPDFPITYPKCPILQISFLAQMVNNLTQMRTQDTRIFP